MTAGPVRPDPPFSMGDRGDVPAGLTAWAQPGPKGFATDRRGTPRVRRVRLRTAEPDALPQRPPGVVSDADWRWLAGGEHTWAGLTGRFGNEAERVVLALVAAGCGTTEHRFATGRIEFPPMRWIPAESLVQERREQLDGVRTERENRQRRADAASVRLAEAWPGVAGSLTGAASGARGTALLAAAEDLADGVTHDGVRAFAQAHTGDSKAFEDLPRWLREAGWEPDALVELGVSRSPYLGVGGPVRVTAGGAVIDTTGWPGPHDLRLTPGVRPRVEAASSLLLVIENRQAAETACDLYPDLAVIWCHGQPSDTALDLIGQAARTARTVLICPDADLGGVAIAARIHDALPETDRRVVDVGSAVGSAVGAAVGAGDGPQPASFTAGQRERLARWAQRADGVGQLASACLTRGHRVEQEAAVRAALRATLSRDIGQGSWRWEA